MSRYGSLVVSLVRIRNTLLKGTHNQCHAHITPRIFKLKWTFTKAHASLWQTIDHEILASFVIVDPHNK